MELRKVPLRKDGRVIIHFDYDCFYASVFEAKNPSLKSLPFAVQQKQIIVTCNYEARRRGLHKLQLIRDARRICPEVIIELGEDISRFRDASKELFNFIKSFSWNNKLERLGFDEVWMDITDIVDYNLELLNRHDLQHCFFQVSADDPTRGFAFDARTVAGHAFPEDSLTDSRDDFAMDIAMRLHLGSHFAMYLRHQLESEKGYTSTVGIATSKLLSKLVGNLNKPKGQTTLMPPLSASPDQQSNVTSFLDTHEIGKVPGIGFKLAQKLREAVLHRPAAFDAGLIYGGTLEKVSVADLRNHQDVNPDMLERLLSGPGSPHGIGYKIWCLIHGIDDTEVSNARAVPHQISIEDSYIRLDTLPEVINEFKALARSLINRMRIDLLGSDDMLDEAGLAQDARANEDVTKPVSTLGKKWLARPRTLRLTTRPRQPLQPDGTRVRSFKRISHSAPLPSFVLSLQEHVDALAEKLVKDVLITMFRKLHPEKSGWNLSLVNLAVTNMSETASDSKSADGRDIENMFRKQDDVLKDFRVTDMSATPGPDSRLASNVIAPGPLSSSSPEEEANDWIEEEDGVRSDDCCRICGMRMPAFAMVAHQRYHSSQTD